MPIGYEICDKIAPAVIVTANNMLAMYHSELVNASVTFTYIFARADRNEAGEKMANPVMIGGYPAAAKIKVIGLKERADGRADVELVIDEDAWKSKNEAQQAAMLDGCFEYLELKLDPDTSEVLTDDLGRPRLKLKKCDHRFSWFDSVALRHREASIEVIQARAFADEHGQVYFGWVDNAPKSDPNQMTMPQVMQDKPGEEKGKKVAKAAAVDSGVAGMPDGAAKQVKGKKGRKSGNPEPLAASVVDAGRAAGVKAGDKPTMMKAKDLGISTAEILGARYPELREELERGEVPKIIKTLTIWDDPYIAIPSLSNEPGGYQLLPIVAALTEIAAVFGDAVPGALVNLEGKGDRRIGSPGIFVAA